MNVLFLRLGKIERESWPNHPLLHASAGASLMIDYLDTMSHMITNMMRSLPYLFRAVGVTNPIHIGLTGEPINRFRMYYQRRIFEEMNRG